MDLFDLAKRLNGTVHPETAKNIAILNAQVLEKATATDISYITKPTFLTQAQRSAAGVILSQNPVEGKICLLVESPYLAFALAQQALNPKKSIKGQQLHERCYVDPSTALPANIQIKFGAFVGANCSLGEGVIIEENAVVQDNACLGNNTAIGPNVTIYQGVIIGDDCYIGSNTTIGGDGFGYAPNNGKWAKIAHTGTVRVGHRVYMGSNNAIDRGSANDTIIGDDVIIDNLVHIAHNVSIGRGSALAGQIGIAGTASIGENCMFGGQTGIADHVQITNNVIGMARAMITSSIKQPGVYGGQPAAPIKQWRKNSVLSLQLEKMYNRIKELEKHTARKL